MNAKNTRPFLEGIETTFLGKYPQIESLRVEYEQTEDRMPRERRRGILSESMVDGKVRCGFDRCHDGGFEIVETISSMVTKKLTELDHTLSCNGHEMLGKNLPGSRCLNHLNIKVQITYRDEGKVC